MTTIVAARSKLSFAALVVIAGGCSTPPAGDVVRARMDVVNHTRTALDATSITSVLGTYGAACTGRSGAGTDTWTVSISGGPAGDELSVDKNDTSCVLTVTSIVTAGGTYDGAPAIDLSVAGAYKGSASSFAISGAPITFYGNAKIDALTYSADFTISLIVSDAPNASDSGNKGATSFTTVSATISAGTVPASDYNIDFSSFGIAKDVNSVVQSVSGYAQLGAGSVTGQDYAIYAGALDGTSNVADVTTAFAGASTSGMLSALTTLELPASGFGLAGLDLGTHPQRTVIVRNTDSGVSSYELLLVTFVP